MTVPQRQEMLVMKAQVLGHAVMIVINATVVNI
jgi:hypothetical protein